MTLITLLVALAAGRYIEDPQRWRPTAWFGHYVARMRAMLGSASLWDGPLGVLVILVLPLLAVALLQDWFHGVLFGLLSLLFGIAVLIYCLGPTELDKDVDAYLDAQRAGSREAAERGARGLGVGGENLPADLDHAVADAVLVQANERTFAVVFWFALLGPLGAALYRLAAMFDGHLRAQSDAGAGLAASARRLHEILGWIPARLVALSYALSGSFVDAMHAWRSYGDERAGQFSDSNTGVLVSVGNGALQRESAASAPTEGEGGADAQVVQSAMALVWRTLIVWVTVIALLTLAGWAA